MKQLKCAKAFMPLCLFSILLSAVLSGCSGGGGGGYDDGVSPILESVTVEPSSAAAGLTLTISGSFSFTDTDGDLNGGSFNYTYEGTTFSFPLPAELAGITSYSALFQLDVILSTSTGTQSIPFWLIDNGGRRSNIVYVDFAQLWTRQFGTLLEDISYGIAIDASDSVVLTGNTSGNLNGENNQGLSDVFVTKYGKDTTRQWTRLIGSGSSDNGRAVAIDSSNNIYVAGDTSGTAFDGKTADGLLDGFVSRFSADGTKVWTRIIGNSGTLDQPYAIAIDSSDNLYIAGETTSHLDGETNAGGYDAFLSKFDTNGNRLWTRLLGSSFSDSAFAVITDTTGNVYLAGGTEGVLGTDPSPGDSVINFDAFVAKYDSAGALQWVSQLGTACGEWARGVTLDNAGGIAITGRILQCALPGNTANGLYDAFVVKLDASGNPLWIRQFGTANHDSGNAINSDSSGNLYVTGYRDSAYFSDDNEGNNIFLSRFDNAGNVDWLVQEDASYRWGNQGTALALDSTENLFVTGMVHGQLDGHTNSNAGEDDVFILKYDGSGIKR